jgi:hypothetical protein
VGFATCHAMQVTKVLVVAIEIKWSIVCAHMLEATIMEIFTKLDLVIEFVKPYC